LSTGLDDALSIFRHEFAHGVAINRYFSTIPDERWLRAIAADTHSVSDYGNTLLREDFAEAVHAYLATDGGATNPAVRAGLKHRFEILNEMFSMNR
jgi:hypothetical protein